MGAPDPVARAAHDFGPRDRVRVCLFLDRGVDEQAGRDLIARAWASEADVYGLDIEVVRVQPWRRPSFKMEGILAGLRQIPLAPPCDRVLALVGRNVGDFLWAFVGPEVLGAVNDESLTHGYVVASWGSVNQFFMPPTDVMRHEIYHLLGCGEHSDMRGCYTQIEQLKAWKRTSGSDFFPGWDRIGQRMLHSRAEVNARVEEVSGTVARSDEVAGKGM